MKNPHSNPHANTQLLRAGFDRFDHQQSPLKTGHICDCIHYKNIHGITMITMHFEAILAPRSPN